MEPKLGETIYFDFVTHNASTGAISDADSTPTIEVFEEDTDTPVLTPTATKRTGKTGNYRTPVVVTSGNGFEVGKSYSVIAIATVSGVTGKGRIGSFQVRARSKDDLAYPAVSGRSLAVSAGGAADAQVKGLDADTITAASIAAGALTAAKFAAGAFNGVWDVATRSLTTYGTLVADIWAYSTRTLTSYGTLITDTITQLFGTAITGAYTAGTVKAWIRKTYARAAGKNVWDTVLKKLRWHDPLDGTPAPGAVITEFDLNTETNPTTRTPV